MLSTSSALTGQYFYNADRPGKSAFTYVHCFLAVVSTTLASTLGSVFTLAVRVNDGHRSPLPQTLWQSHTLSFPGRGPLWNKTIPPKRKCLYFVNKYSWYYLSLPAWNCVGRYPFRTRWKSASCLMIPWLIWLGTRWCQVCLLSVGIAMCWHQSWKVCTEHLAFLPNYKATKILWKYCGN